MRCANCGKPLKDGAAFCTECGAVQHIVRSDAAPPPPRKKLPKGCLVALIVTASIFALIIIIAISSFYDYANTERPPSVNTTPPVTTSPEVPPSPEASTAPSEEKKETPTPIPTPTPTPAESKEEYIASCITVNYKDLLRTPEDYIGTRVAITVKISQILSGGFLADYDQYFRCYSDTSGYGWYIDDEYIVADYRQDNSLKLLNDDIIIVYGEYYGTETIYRALTGTGDELPRIDMYFVDLIGE